MRSLPIIVLVLVAGLFSACSRKESSQLGNAKGGRHYGGILNWNETSPVGDLFPLGLATVGEFRIASLVYQGLVRLDPVDLTVKPCLAESWKVSDDGTVYTFTLRPGLYFQPNAKLFPKGPRSLTAKDVEDCFRRLCTAAPGNEMFWLFQGRVKGADEHYFASKEGKEQTSQFGVQATDDQTLVVELLRPEPLFLQILAHQGCWIYPAEVYAQPLGERDMVGTGPFVLHTRTKEGVVVFERAAGYWDVDEHGNALPYLDGVRVTFEPDQTKEFDQFLQGRLSLLADPPLERLAALSDTLDPLTGALRFHVERLPGLVVQYYGFNADRVPFNDLKVRKAFAMAINQRYLVDSVLRGAAMVAEHGIVPSGLGSYPNELVRGHGYNPDSARALLAMAGYPGGKGFPPVRLQVNNDGFGYVRVAEAVQVMIEKELGIGLIISVLPADQHYDWIDEGHALLWRQGWTADYPDPENFLTLFLGQNAVLDTSLASPLNTTRYHNARFDSLYLVARALTDPAARMRTLAMAEDQAMRDVTVVPLYHMRTLRLLQPWVKGLPANVMDLRDVSKAWFDPALTKR